MLTVPVNMLAKNPRTLKVSRYKGSFVRKRWTLRSTNRSSERSDWRSTFPNPLLTFVVVHSLVVRFQRSCAHMLALNQTFDETRSIKVEL